MFKLIKKIRNATLPEIVKSDLVTVLNSLNPKFSYSFRVEALADLMDWLRLPVKTKDASEVSEQEGRNLRLRFLFQFLERNKTESDYLAATLKELTSQGSAVGLYCLTGLSENTGFINGLSNRLVQRALPETFREQDLSEVFKVVFTEITDAQWFENSYQEISPLIIQFFKVHDIKLTNLMDDRFEAMVILSSQVMALGSARDIRSRLSNKKISGSSFFRLHEAVSKRDNQELVLKEISACRLNLEEVKVNLEQTGVSVDLIFKLEKMEATLDRIEMLIYLGKEYGKEAGPIMAAQFMGRLIRDELKTVGVKDYLKQNLQHLTRKIVERAGEKGHHYIATTSVEKNHLFVAASWAGVLTAFTAVTKFYIGVGNFPLFFEGFFFFINYAIGFLLMQKWHLALSSKQPAYMASALSKKFENFKETRELHETILEVRKISLSQLLASIGNLLWVIPTTIALDWIWYFISGHHMVSLAGAQDIIHKHHPFEGLTIFYAAFTGVLLWLSSVVAGWTENWIVYRNLPLALRSSPFFTKFFGKERLSEISSNLASNLGSVAGNLSIAAFLATPIIIGKLTAIPLDIRHVTLAAGTVTLALNSLEWDYIYWPQILTMIVSILCIGVLNFGVSFYCSIRMAAMAREVDSKYLKIIFKFAFMRRRSKFPE